MIKAVFVDIDKTLLNSKGEVTKRTVSAIQKAKENGIQIVLISGRSRMSAIKFQEFSSRYLINCNGADLYDYQEKEVLYQSVMDSQFCQQLYEMANEEEMVIKLDFGLSRAVNQPEYLEDYEIHLTEKISDFLQQNQIIQIAMCSENENKIEKVKNWIEKQTNFVVTNQFIWEVNGKQMKAIHITNSNVSKGNTMAALSKFLKIDLNDVIAIGDKTNDISMIKMAGIGVAMGNAPEEIKKIADRVTVSNEEDGVAEVLEKILEEK